MKAYEVKLSKVAVRYLEKLDSKTANRIKENLRHLKEDPFRCRSGADIKQLSGSSNPVFYRIRIGDYRAVFVVLGSEVRITEIMPRGKGYEWLE